MEGRLILFGKESGRWNFITDWCGHSLRGRETNKTILSRGMVKEVWGFTRHEEADGVAVTVNIYYSGVDGKRENLQDWTGFE